MSILGSIMSSILGGQAQPPPPASLASAEPQHAPAESRAPPVAPTPPDVKRAAQQPQAAHSERPAAPAAATATQVDVAAVLDKLAGVADQKLDWRTSIVDLMKLLELDSSLDARKTLAKELSYTGSTKDSAAMNVWLHKQVMAKLVQGGGKLPADLSPKA